MKKLISMILAFVLLGCTVNVTAKGEAQDEKIVFSYDFDLRFGINIENASFIERKHLQGYADFLESIGIKGNLSWNTERKSIDLNVALIPLSNPDSAIQFRFFGIPTMMCITSPLFGDEKLQFRFTDLVHFAEQAYAVFPVPMIYLFLLDPYVTIRAFSCLTDVWIREVGSLRSIGSISYKTLQRIADEWEEQIESDQDLSSWVISISNLLPDDEILDFAIHELPQMLLNISGKKKLTIKNDKNAIRLLSASGEKIWEETSSPEEGYSCALNVPDNGTVFLPSFFFKEKETEGKNNVSLQLGWNRSSNAPDTSEEGKEYPESLLSLSIEAENIPIDLPMESSFTVKADQQGYILPVFHCAVNGKTSANGNINLVLSQEDDNGRGFSVSCTGTIIPAEREDRLVYTYSDLYTPYNLLILSFRSQKEFIDKVDRQFVLGLLDFVYELPVSSCQSIMDDLEKMGILRTVLER